MNAAELSRLIRDKYVWSQIYLSNKLKMPSNGIHYIETGKRKPSRKNALKLVKLAQKLSITVTVEDLLR